MLTTVPSLHLLIQGDIPCGMASRGLQLGLEECLKDIQCPDDVCQIKTTLSAPMDGPRAEWLYGICRQEIKLCCTYPLRECLPDHMVMGLYVGKNMEVKLFGLKSLPKSLMGDEVLQLFENQFQDAAKYFRVCGSLMVRKSQANEFESMAQDCAYSSGDFFFGDVSMDDECNDSVAVSRQASIAYGDVYRRAPQQQPLDSEMQMTGAMKHMQNDSTALNNVASIEANCYNSVTNQGALDNCVTQQCMNVKQSDINPVVPLMSALQIDTNALVPGKYACAVVVTDEPEPHRDKGKEEGGLSPAEQVLPNNHAEKVVQFRDSQLVIGSSVRELNTCPFQNGKPEDLACYVHALEIAYSVQMAECTPDCESYLQPYMEHVKQEINDLKSRQTASEMLKSFIREHCLMCHRLSCNVPHLAAGCRLSATTYKSSTATTNTHSPISSAGTQSTAFQPVAGATNVSYDLEPFQNSVASGFIKTPIPEHNPDADCRVHFPIQSHGNGTVHMPHEAVYLIPAPGGKRAHINQLLVQSKEDLPHDLSNYPHGTVIYSAKRTDNMQDMQHIFSPGSHNSWIPDFLKAPTTCTTLGRGGNGITFAYTVSNTDFAVKETKYRRSEIQLWRQFDHPNVIPLLAVVSLQSGRCLQFMPQMACNLRHEMQKIECLKSLLLAKGEEFWIATVLPNLKHILRSTLNGLVHLHNDHNVQHCDMKPHNILICYECRHDHSKDSVFSCNGPRCAVKICDFDSVKEFSSIYYRADRTKAKTEIECSKVLGTKGYRAPEKFLKPDLEQNPTALGADIEGPWCDIWSFGSCVLIICQGPDHKKDIDMMKKDKLNDTDEYLEPLVRVTLLCTESLLLQDVCRFAARCVKPQPTQRPTAQDLLKDPFLS